MVRRSGADMMGPRERDQWRVLGLVHNHLAAFDEDAAARWWATPRAELGGRSPESVLSADFSPDDPVVQDLVTMVQRDAHPPGVTDQPDTKAGSA